MNDPEPSTHQFMGPDTFNWREAATVLLAILALVILGELLSAWLRRWII